MQKKLYMTPYIYVPIQTDPYMLTDNREPSERETSLSQEP